MKQYAKQALNVIEIEARAVQALSERIDENFDKACDILLSCKGRIVVIGMGKSGHIGSKIAATFASTGSPSFFVHPAEASHGDLGMITERDVVLAISNSGKTHEILALLPLIKHLKIPLVAMTGNKASPLARAASVNLDVGIDTEACPLGLAPTTSTTVSLVMGDALAIALLDARGFTKQDFAFSHPGGNLGKRLLLKVDDLSHKGEAIPVVLERMLVSDALLEVTEKKLGMTCVVDETGVLKGVFTDGDIRRALHKDVDIHQTLISQVMTPNCRTIDGECLAFDALKKMEQHKITTLVITESSNRPVGVISMHDLVQAGLM